MWFKPWDDDIENRITNAEMRLRVDLMKELEKSPNSQLQARVADLEVKMSKLWSLLVEQTPRKQDKLSKYGRRFGGAARDKL